MDKEIKGFVETPDTVHGRLLESAHYLGYSAERACKELLWLLEEDRWRGIKGIDDISSFTATIDFADFKLAREQRKKISEKLKVLGATQRETAKAIGVNQTTVARDLKPDANASVENDNSIQSKEIKSDPDANASTSPFHNDPTKTAAAPIQKAEQTSKKEAEKQEKLEQEKAKAKDFVIDESICDFRHGDIKTVFDDIPDGSIDLILTDPPYPKEFIEVWSDLAILAKRVLKPNGFVIAYSGQLNLPEVMRRMSEHLQYYWIFSLIHTGSRQLINARNLFCGWKPLLVFQNGFKKRETPIDDFINGSGLAKDLHDWQQSELELKSIIENFTSVGDTIMEPFAGSGTTMKAAIKLKRKVIGAEINKDTYDIAKGGISELF